MLIAIVEDSENVRDALAGYLKLEGMEVAEYGDLASAKTGLVRNAADLLVLDIMLPDGDGFLFAKELKKTSDIPILFLTARDQESDRVTGLELGADDYVVKPFSPKEVVLRIKGILRRTSAPTSDSAGSVKFAVAGHELALDTQSHRIDVGGVPVELTAAEWNILTYLAQRTPRVFSRIQLLENCLGSIAEGSERTVDTHVKNIRRKLGAEEWIVTVRGFGYRFGGDAL